MIMEYVVELNSYLFYLYPEPYTSLHGALF